MKKLLTAISAAALASCLCLAGCSSSNAAASKQEGPIYLPATVTNVDEGGMWAQSVAYSYDANGNLLSLTETGTKLTGGTSISFVDGSATSYDSGQTSVSTTAYVLDANGLPTEYTKTGTNDDGSQFSNHYTLDVQADSSGLPQTVSLVKDNGETEYAMSYTYENGLISGIERTYVPNNNTLGITFDADGWETEELKNDSIEFSYDENGNITEVIKNGEVITTVQYVKIDSPSAFAYSHSHLKIKLSGLIMYPSASSSLLPLACWLPNGSFML